MFARLLDTQTLFLFSLTQTRKHVLQLAGHFFHTRWRHDFDANCDLLGSISISLSSSSPWRSFAEHLSGRVFSVLRSRHWSAAAATRPKMRSSPGPPLAGDFLHLLLTQQVDCCIRQVSNDGFHIASHITHFGNLVASTLINGALASFASRRAPQFANTGWTDHQNIFWTDFIA